MSSGTDGTVLAEGKQICVNGAILNCPIHGSQPVNGNLDADWFINGKNVALDGSTAACGAVITASAVKTFGV